MRAVKFIRRSPLFSDSERCLLINRIQPQIRWLIQSDLRRQLSAPRPSFASNVPVKSDSVLPSSSTDEDSKELEMMEPGAEGDTGAGLSPQPLEAVWRYGQLFTPQRTGSKTLFFWQNELRNFLYDIDLEQLDTDRDGSILGIRYKKKSADELSPPVGSDPFDQVTHLLPFLAGRFRPVPVEELPTQLALGRGVMAHFRPPRSRHFSLQVWAASDPTSPVASSSALASTVVNDKVDIPLNPKLPAVLDQGNKSTQSTAEHPLDLPPFESSDFQFYSSARNKIEAKFLDFEDFIVMKIQNFVRAIKQSKEDFLCSEAVERARVVRDTASALPSLVSSALAEDHNRSSPSLHSRDLSNINNLKSFWAGVSNDGHRATVPAKMAPPIRVTAAQAPPSSQQEDQEVVMAVRYRLLDESFIALRHLRLLHLRHLPLVIPNPHPAEAASKTFSTLRLARAEFVLFATLIALGAAPATYRGLNFSFAHPTFAKIVAASIVGTIAYTAWSSRLKMEMAAKLLIEEATVSRLVSQDGQTTQFIQQQYLDVCTDAVMLLYSVKLTKQRMRNVDKFVAGEAGNSGMDNDLLEFIRHSEELDLAQPGSTLLVQPLQEKANQLLQAWDLVGKGSRDEDRSDNDGVAAGEVCEVELVETVLGRQECCEYSTSSDE
mmetsp:Transcript_8725/g.14825  ORF Transcript_8725/g.14825 Transcript_8725/m.14825 type:complete len:661 (-) Transcript_8725:19-2001(-)